MIGRSAILLFGAVGVLANCSGPAGWSQAVYVGPEQKPHETFTWYGPIGDVYDADGTDPRVGRVAPGRVCELRRIVNRPDYNDVKTRAGTLMTPRDYQRTLFSECLEPGKDTQ